MAKKTAKDIVKESLPEMEIVEPSSKATPDVAPAAAKHGVSLDRLREKYLGSVAREPVASAADGEEAGDQDVEVKQVRPKHAPADPVDDPGPRAVIIDRKRGIIGSQG